MTPAEHRAHDYLARRAVTAETRLSAVAALHQTDRRRKACCVECGTRWPCRTSQVVNP